MIAPVVLALVAVLVVVGAGRVVASERVTRRRLAWFALRQRLAITSGNGNRVLTYLMVTRRWRRGGLVVALVAVAYVEWWRDRVPHVEALAAFAGWFAGMVLAEWRIDALERGNGVRTASLRRRGIGDYVERRLLALPALAWLGFAVATVLGLARWTRLEQRATFLVLAAVGIAIGVVLVLVSRRVVTRGRPALPADVLAADEALRSRSLRVLTGAATAIGGYLAAATYASVVHRPDVATTDGQWVAQLLGLALAPAVGIAIAVAPRRAST